MRIGRVFWETVMITMKYGACFVFAAMMSAGFAFGQPAERMPWPESVRPSANDAFILTPRPLRTPSINCARVFGARPEAPIRFLVAASGERPMRFEADLPDGLQINRETGLITGILTDRGDFEATIRVSNRLGEDTATIVFKIGDTIGLTPPMGWNSWNCWGHEVSQENVLLSARAMVDSGLIDHGWTYINIDDTWQSHRAGSRNSIQSNEKFPDMAGLAREVHEMGLKVGIYSTPWITSYALDIGGSSDTPDGAWDESMASAEYYRLGEYSFEVQDAEQWAAWGFDYVKYDWFPNDVPTTPRMREALDATGRDIILSLSNKAPMGVAASELARLSNLARTTRDIRDEWRWSEEWVHQGIAEIWDQHEAWAPHCRPGFFPDADMLVVGRVSWTGDPKPSRLSPDEQYTHVSLWCLWASPLLIGCPLEDLDRFTLSLLTNDEVLAINQDPLGVMGVNVSGDRDLQVVAKPLSDGSIGVGLFNRTDEPAEVEAAWSDLGIDGAYMVRDLWRQRDVGVRTGSFAREVAPRGVFMVRLTPVPTSD